MSSYGAGSLDIFEIIGDKQSVSNVTDVVGSDFEKDLLDLLRQEVLSLAVQGQASARSMVPVRNFELSNNILINAADPFLMTVGVSPAHRSSSRTNDQLFNSDLAAILDSGISRKSPRNSKSVIRTNKSGRRRKRRVLQAELVRRASTPSIDGFPSGVKGSPTADWIGKAQENLLLKLGL